MVKKLLLIDGHSILNRAFFGLPDLTNAKGIHTNAVYGFLNIMLKLIDAEQPGYLTVAFDVHAPTFRHKLYEAYKGTRGAMAPELKQQVPMMKEMLHAMGIVTVEKEGLEADDILGTLATRAAAEGMEVVIVSGDRDLLQLAGEHIKISIPKTKKTGTEIENYYAKDVLEQKGVTPTEFIDVKALWGDTSDNIPGVPSIGEKTATAIIQQYHTVEEAIAHADEVRPPRASANLKEYAEQALLSKTLATIEINADVDYDIESAKLGELFTPEAYLLCKEWEFKNLMSRFEGAAKQNDKAAEEGFVSVASVEEAAAVMKDFAAGEPVGCFLHEKDGKIAGLSLSDGRKAFWYPLAGAEEAKRLLCQVTSLLAVAEDEAVNVIGAGVSPNNTILAARDLKELLWIAQRGGFADEVFDTALQRFDFSAVFDTSVAAYLINPLAKTYTTEDIARDVLGISVPSETDLFGKVKMQKAYDELPEAFFKYACYESMVAAKAVGSLNEVLKQAGMKQLYDEIELPLVFTLFAMEREGFAIDGSALMEYGESLTGRIGELEKRIYEAAGEEFNINSPKQLGEILFGKLKLPNGKKTKSGYSTAADVLDKLAPEYPIVSDILEYRQLAKLKSTYADGLFDCIDADGRIRTTFQQTVTATGRLSSTEPNLQNIPIRMEIGRQIRKVFLPKDGYVFVDADYSQIELRVLAHMSGDENLIEAYRENKDIHRATAALVFHKPFDEVTEADRRSAKAVNFGIVYGISSFGLGQDLDITRQEAQKYIDDYYVAYPRLKTFLDGVVESAKETGFSFTMYGRRRPVPELSSSNFMQRSFGERVAMNSPIQGTAADIIKLAMLRVHKR
ncbi:MAG: DNA polymerase I [Lachnospiraceae bacterium]|nr:DNA polymerase I [Lachnospiraceae bacterium]